MKKDKVKASVIIPTSNNPVEVMRAIRSLREQILTRDDVEVIVVDDGSEPSLEEFLGDEADEYFPRFVRNEKVLGRGGARNAGVQASRGEIVIFMDSDMTAHPEFVQRHIDAYGPEGALACVGHVIWTGTSTICRYLETRGVKKLKSGEPVPWRYLDSSNFSCRKKDFDRAGSFNEEIKEWGGEDTLMGFDLHRTGVTLNYLKGAVTYHHRKIELGGLCEKNYTFGRDSLPIMVKGRPDIARDLRARYLMTPAKDERWTIKERVLSLLIRGLVRFPGHYAVKSLLSISGQRISILCYDYLVYSSILRGFRDFLQVDGQDTGGKGETLRDPDPGDHSQNGVGVM
jgi:glycosyltransferase involved in cell wall biosynthesis